MSDETSYGDWRALELAIKDAAKKRARQAGAGISATTVDAQIRQARYDRFLSRVFANGEESEWLLKGGLSMLARVPRTRTTKDVDLAAPHAADLHGAEQALSALVAVDLGDHLTFRLIRSIPTGLGDNQIGTETRRLIYGCFDVDNDSQVDTVTVDVVVGPEPTGTPEIVEPANRLLLARPLIAHSYRLFPVTDQIADKVCATMSTNYAGNKRSSRGELRAAITTKLAISGMEPFHHFDIPADWKRTYPATAKGVPLAQTYTAETAASLVARFIDPALTNDPEPAEWDPHELQWISRS